MRLAMVGTLLFALIITSGCAGSFADPSGKHRTFKIAQRRYTELVRWGELERASAFVATDLQSEFLDHADQMDGIRVSDFESGFPDFSDNDNTVTITVVYHAYSSATLVERKIRERQEWHREEGIRNEWRVRPDLKQFLVGTAKSTQ